MENLKHKNDVKGNEMKRDSIKSSDFWHDMVGLTNVKTLAQACGKRPFNQFDSLQVSNSYHLMSNKPKYPLKMSQSVN